MVQEIELMWYILCRILATGINFGVFFKICSFYGSWLGFILKAQIML